MPVNANDSFVHKDELMSPAFRHTVTPIDAIVVKAKHPASNYGLVVKHLLMNKVAN